MVLRWLCRQRNTARPTSASVRRAFTTSSPRYGVAISSTAAANAVSERTRNIGIIAHIDAGKTTTTERMLYYSGYSRRIGDVDEGSTVTDFLPAERARGITIQSAAITFSWPPLPPNTTPSSQPLDPAFPRSSSPHNINLIDTPGHADFTFEVLRSLRVLDGAVCILDAVAGVEAQTEKVWAQAQKYEIPRLVFVNKLDREGAAFGRTIKDIGARLHVWPAVCGVPWWKGHGEAGLVGVGDVIGLQGLRWQTGGDGKDVECLDLPSLEKVNADLATELKKARIALVELLAEHDDEMVEKYLEADEDHLTISPQDIRASLRRCTLQSPQRLVPVFAGASFRNIGVQPLLDAVVDLLPSPSERPDPGISLLTSMSDTASRTNSSTLSAFLASDNATASKQSKSFKSSKALSKDRAPMALAPITACALAFKVVNDARRGVLVYVRVYAGSITKNAALWNTNLHNSERAQRLLRMYANDTVEIDSIDAGQIGVIPSLKHARTGDTLVGYTGANPKVGPQGLVSGLQLRPIDVPPPVFFVSVEPESLGEERHVRDSLALLLREDPSLSVTVDEESGQTHLSGMGELHLEIARDRLVEDFKAKARIGKIEIGYREAVEAESEEVTEVYERDVSGKTSKAACTVSVAPRHEGVVAELDQGETHQIALQDENTLLVSTPTLDASGSPTEEGAPSLPLHLSLPTVLHALQTGVQASLARGPTHSYPLHSTTVRLTFDPSKHLFPTTTPASLSSAARLAVQAALKASSASGNGTAMMEPVMQVAIAVDEASLGGVVHDLSSARGGQVLSLDSSETGTASLSDSAGILEVDLERIYTPPDPYANEASSASGSSGMGTAMRQVTARVPLKEMVGYLKHLRSLTGGRGTFTMAVDRFERMSSVRVKAVLSELRGEAGW